MFCIVLLFLLNFFVNFVIFLLEVLCYFCGWCNCPVNYKLIEDNIMQISNRKSIILAVILSSSLLIQGCSIADAILGPLPEDCEEYNQSAGLTSIERSAKSCGRRGGGHQVFLNKLLRTVFAYTGYSLYDVDFGQFKIDITTENASYQNLPGTFSVQLFSGNNVIGEQQFAYKASNNTLTLSNPQAVQNWVAGYDGLADGYKISLTGIQLSNQSGQHGYNATAKFGDRQFASFSWQGSAGNDCNDCVMK